MFNKNELKVISRALTSYNNQLIETKETIEEDYLPGDEEMIELLFERIVDSAKVYEKVQEELWKMIHGKEVK